MKTLLATAGACALLAISGAEAADMSSPKDNPLLAPWTGPYGGVPPFNKIQIKDFKPALTKGMDLSRADIKVIAESKDAATFENTIAALEDSGRPFSRAGSMFGTYTSTMNSKPMQAVEKEMAPVLAAFSDEITQNEPLFQRIKTVYDNAQKNPLPADQQRVVQLVY